MTRTSRIGCLTAVVLALSVTAACSSARDPEQDLESTEGNLAGGVFAECEIPGAANKAIDTLLKVLHSKGIQIGAEVILVFDHDLETGHQAVELLVGGVGAWHLGAAVGVGRERLRSMLDHVHTNAGLLAGVTIPIPFSGKWSDIHIGLDAFWGADVGPLSGGRWKLIWSSDSSEIGLEGFWGSLQLARWGGVCGGGGIVFGTDQDARIIKTAWNNLISGGARPMTRGADTLCNRAAAYDNIDKLKACIESGRGNGGAPCLFDGDGRYKSSSGNPIQLCGAASGGNYGCDLGKLTSCLRGSGGKGCFDACWLINR